MDNKYKFIIIEGNIGVGKTSLVKKLAHKYNAKTILEEFAENTFLPKFYKNPERYALPLELSFLTERYKQLTSSFIGKKNDELIIADYYYQKSLVFASATLNTDEYKLYTEMFNLIFTKIKDPDLFVFLHKTPSEILKQIKLRGRSYEQNIDIKYLEDLQKKYSIFINQKKNLKILLIDISNFDFINKEKDFEILNDIIFNRNYKIGINTLHL